jgi:hypothetical protein
MRAECWFRLLAPRLQKVRCSLECGQFWLAGRWVSETRERGTAQGIEDISSIKWH